MKDWTLYGMDYENFGLLGQHTQYIPAIPSSLTNNLFCGLRDYQEKALRFLAYHVEQKKLSQHLLFDMATGSGKTLIMAASMLYFYTRGYRRFLFCSNREVIVKKMKGNLLESNSPKFLFKGDILSTEGDIVCLHEVGSFSRGGDQKDMEIIFTTVQKLHGDLRSPSENGISEATFDEKMVILADEAHHLQAKSKGKPKNNGLSDEGSWEESVLKIHKACTDNYLLEFTATMDLENSELNKKYQDKLLMRYPLRDYCKEGYSKEICCMTSDVSVAHRMLQALLLSEYRREILYEAGVSIKPVILFKSMRIGATKQLSLAGQLTPEEQCESAEGAYEYFVEDLIPHLDVRDFDPLSGGHQTIQKALEYFGREGEGLEQLVKRLQRAFSKENCCVVHSGKRIEDSLVDSLNKLEQEDEPIRVIFAVNMLDEGWDVLNLFDIVRLYETKQGKRGKAHSTMQEAQLIGRGARYCPFSLNGNEEERYKRKFDEEPRKTPLGVRDAILSLQREPQVCR